MPPLVRTSDRCVAALAAAESGSTTEPPGNRSGAWRAAHDEQGQAAAEFALISVLLFTVAFGGFDFARALGAWSTVEHASREGARTASVRCTVVADCRPLVQDAIERSLAGLNVARASWTMDAPPYVSGGSIRVNVEYEVIPVIPMVAALVPGGIIAVHGDTTMRLE